MNHRPAITICNRRGFAAIFAITLIFLVAAALAVYFLLRQR